MSNVDTYKLRNFDELLEAVETGLDVEFFIDEVRYNISWSGGKPFICICPYGDAIFFEDANDLLCEYKVNGTSIKELWKDINIYSM
ncbi:MAG: hypothetical protein IJC09_01890 [Clostridia bacterium]|nr:hypothetical protein [Clostridia bacterium]